MNTEQDNIISEENLEKLNRLENEHVFDIVTEYVKLCSPKKVTVITDVPEDIEYVKKKSLENGEEAVLSMKGHTYHFDGMADQGRDKAVTKVLVKKGQKLGNAINTGEREECLSEIREKLSGIMKDKEMFVAFFTLGPENSKFSIPALQITDSAYVVHSESMLYRNGYQEFMRLKGSDKFFHFVHSAGELNENKTSKHFQDKRIYIDLESNRVFSVNTQYAGNSLGLKKLALRLAIKRSHDENWLCEHMFIMGAKNSSKNRKTYFTGAFPSACGKTSTAMIPGQNIVGDDIAYLKIEDGVAYAANVEQGVFGIIENVNHTDDPLIYETLTSEREVIFSNVLIKDDKPYWLGMGEELPKEGLNYSGPWQEGKMDESGAEIKPAHPNARYTIRLKDLANVDENLDNPNGVPVSGIIYGGRDYDVSPPVVESFDWKHGVFVGAALESVTTATVVGAVGQMAHNPMANIDFMVVPLGTYIKNHLKFGENLNTAPKIFATNYFLKDEGKFLNEKVDKKVWLMWMEGRVHGDYNAIKTPIGFIPEYEDLRVLFGKLFNRKYDMKEYVKAFSIRIENWLDRLNRIEEIFNNEENIPADFIKELHSQRKRLQELEATEGKIISPFTLEKLNS